MTIKTANINYSLVSLSRTLSNHLKKIKDDWGYMFAVTLNQELRHGHSPDEVKQSNPLLMYRTAEHVPATPKEDLQPPSIDVDLIRLTEMQASETSREKVRKLIQDLEPHLEDIRDILSAFYDYKNNDDDIELDEKLSKQFNLSPKEASDLKTLFTILAHEVEHNRSLFDSLVPTDKIHLEFHPDEQLYLLSDHLHKITRTSRRKPIKD